MAIEHARARAVPKPWGVEDLHPWSAAGRDGIAIGEIWYERPDNGSVDPSLLLKLLFTSQPLSIQVHPDDAFAHSMGLPNGKTEAWYVLSAAPEAKVALGLSRRLTPQQLRTAIDDGSIIRSDRVARGVGKRRHFRACRDDSRDRRRSRHRGTSAAKRHDIPAVRILVAGVNFTSKTPSRWQTPDQPILQTRPKRFTRRTDNSRCQSALRIRADQPPSGLLLVSGSGTRNLASGSQRKCCRGIVRARHRRGPVRTIGRRRDSSRRYRLGGPRGLHGRQPRREFTATSNAAGLDQCQTVKSDAGADFSHSSKGRSKERMPGNA